jgi:cytochrome c oxidase subunit 2
MLEGMKGVSSFASEVDLAIWVVVGLCIGVFILVVGVMFFFLYKYSSKRNPRNKVKNIEHNLPLEIVWTITPMILLAVMFYYGYTSLKAMRTIPEQNMQVKVTGQMWFWTHEYPNGKKTKDLYVPVNQNIKLDITAKINDVLHSYYVPALRLKQDAVPGKIYNAWFRATETGAFDVQCAEYCGTRHSYMLAKVYVLEKDVFDAWYNSDKKTPFDPEETIAEHPGLTLLNDNGCTGCHSLDGSTLVGPSYKDMFGRKVKVSVNGSLKEILTDEAYIKRAILEPDSEVVEGFSSGMMSSYKDILSEEDIDTLIQYFKDSAPQATIKSNVEEKNKNISVEQHQTNIEATLKSDEDIKTKAMSLLSANACLGCHSLDGSKRVGPSYKDMFGRKVKVKIGDSLQEVLSDEAYIKRAILEPNAEIVDTYPAIMTSYQGKLSDEDISLLIEYFRSL